MKINISHDGIKGFAAAILFFAFLRAGFWLAERKPLWNDEIYTQVNSIEPKSYREILQGRLPEGNAFPLFYLFQKGICDLAGFKLPFVWSGDWNVSEHRSQMILRTGPNIFMSLALALLFYSMARNFSWMTAGYALFLALVSPGVWNYWAEARPYALWFFLTTLQSVLLLEILSCPRTRVLPRMGLLLTHVFLSLTTVLGVMQAAVASALLWGSKDKSPFWPGMLCLFPVPLTMLYHSRTVTQFFAFEDPPGRLLLANIPPENLIIGFIYLVALVSWQRRIKSKGVHAWSELGLVPVYLFFSVLILAATGALMGYLMVKYPKGGFGFSIPSRYFMYLTPVWIMMTAGAVHELIKRSRGNVWLGSCLVALCAVLLIMRSLKTTMEIFSF